MTEKIVVGIDYDGVIIPKARSWDLARRTSKMGLGFMPGVLDGIQELQQMDDVDLLGVRTVWPEKLRKKQTLRGLQRLGIDLPVTHTTNSPEEKIAAILIDAQFRGAKEDLPPGGLYSHRVDTKQVVLIDDSVQKIVEGAIRLAETRPEFAPLLKRFTLAAFNPKQPEKIKGKIIPGVVHIVAMQDWFRIGECNFLGA